MMSFGVTQGRDLSDLVVCWLFGVVEENRRNEIHVLWVPRVHVLLVESHESAEQKLKR